MRFHFIANCARRQVYYVWFTEGFVTKDLIDAKALLTTLRC